LIIVVEPPLADVFIWWIRRLRGNDNIIDDYRGVLGFVGG
jgi:hypothetical protein